MKLDLSEAQIRYVMAKIEADVVAGMAVANEVERELDLALMDNEQPRAFAKCLICGEQIELVQMKDFESFSKIEVLKHFRAEHPEVLRDIPHGMPYTPIEVAN